MPSLRDRIRSWFSAPTPPKTSPFREQGTSGVPIWGGYVETRDKSAKWTGTQRYVTAAELATNVSIVAAGVHHFLNLVAHPKWTVKPADENDREAVAAAEFVDDVLSHMTTPLNRVVRRSAMFRFHGFSIQEWTAMRRRDGRVGFKDIEARPQFTIERWAVDPDGTVTGVWQRSPHTGQLLGIARNKFVYLVEDTLTDSPEGLGMFRHMLEPYERLKQMLAIEMRAYERDLRGIPIGRAPISQLARAVEDGIIKKADAQKLIDTLKSIVEIQVTKSNTGAVLDSSMYESQAADGLKVASAPKWGLDLLKGSGGGFTEISHAIDRTQREMARIIGVEHLMMGDVQGNRSLAEDKSRNLYLVANSVLSHIAFTYDRDLITPLWDLNGLDDELRPTLEIEDVSFKDAESVSNTLARMAQAGATLTPNDPAVNDVRDLLGISRQETVDEGMLEDEAA